jgi:hypothetical protein
MDFSNDRPVQHQKYWEGSIPREMMSTSQANVATYLCLMIDFRFDLTKHGTMLRSKFLSIDVAALDFVKTAGRVSRPSDKRNPCEAIVHERSRLVLSSKQARDSVFKRIVFVQPFKSKR